MILLSDYLLGLTPALETNARITVLVANKFLESATNAGIVLPNPLTTSMWRPARYNHLIAKGSKPTSKHCSCSAIDLNDPNGLLERFARQDNEKILEELSLWAEERQGPWLHLQTVHYGSWAPGKTRFFKP